MSSRRSAALRKLVMLAAACPVGAAAQDPGTSPAALPEALVGTEWQLIELRSPEDDIGIARPGDPSLYTMSLQENGVLSMRLDCNRASGTWTASTAGSSFGFGPLRMTRVACQQPSLGVRVARELEYVSSYRVRDGLLYLNLVADGGTLVWERARY
jgi:heat shock protein HslJ